MLARVQRLDGPVRVKVVWQRDVDRVDVRIVQHGIVAVVHPQVGREGAEGVGLVGVGRAQSGQDRPPGPVDGGRHVLPGKIGRA